MLVRARAIIYLLIVELGSGTIWGSGWRLDAMFDVSFFTGAVYLVSLFNSNSSFRHDLQLQKLHFFMTANLPLGLLYQALPKFSPRVVCDVVGLLCSSIV